MSAAATTLESMQAGAAFRSTKRSAAGGGAAPCPWRRETGKDRFIRNWVIQPASAMARRQIEWRSLRPLHTQVYDECRPEKRGGRAMVATNTQCGDRALQAPATLGPG